MSASSDHSRIRDGTPTTFYEDLVRTPGMRGPPNRCRECRVVGFCEAGHTVVGRSSCETRYCPDHWGDWRENSIKAPLKRLAAYRHAQDDPWDKRLVHVVASPPQDRRYSAREFWATRTDSYDALESAGIRGGVNVAHPYRTSDAGNELYRSAVAHGDIDVDYGRWRFLREMSEDWAEMKQYIEAAPHYHALAPAQDVSGDDAPGDWVVENLGSLSRFEIDEPEGYYDMAGRLGYILSHAADQDGKMTTTYFGECHPASFSPAEELTGEELATINKMVEEVVGLDDTATCHDECPHTGCQCRVLPLCELSDRLDDDNWVSGVRDHTDGGRRLAILRGTHAYVEGLCDTPPPSARSDGEQLKTWLKKQGQIDAGTSNRPSQTRQSTFDTAVVYPSTG